MAVAIGIDCGCRTVLDATVMKAQTSAAILASANHGIEGAFGSPNTVPAGVELRSDHGPQTTGHDADALDRAWGVTQTFAPVGRPTGNAVAEWTIRTVKEKCGWFADWPDAPALAHVLRGCADGFNHRRPHQALDWQTHGERRQALLGSVPREAA